MPTFNVDNGTLPDPSPDAQQFANRIVRYEPSVDPNTLIPNPKNPKIHPQQQRAAIKGILGELGWIDTVTVNVQTGRMIDGHDRRDHAIEAGQTVPVIYVDLSPEEEDLALATFDPIGAMANYGPDEVNRLLEDVTTSSEAIATMLADMQVDAAPTFKNTGQTGDRQIERASVVRVAVQVEDVRTVEQALALTSIEDRGMALLTICREYVTLHIGHSNDN